MTNPKFRVINLVEIKMKKIFVIVAIIALLAILFKPSYAVFDVASGEYFMRLDARDAYNRPVENNYRFQPTPFLKTYSMLTPFGICRWQRSPFDKSLKFTREKIFKVPLGAVSYIYSERRILSRFSEKIASREYTHKIEIYLLILIVMLIFEPNLQSKKEPRFRVPILIE